MNYSGVTVKLTHENIASLCNDQCLSGLFFSSKTGSLANVSVNFSDHLTCIASVTPGQFENHALDIISRSQQRRKGETENCVTLKSSYPIWIKLFKHCTDVACIRKPTLIPFSISFALMKGRESTAAENKLCWCFLGHHFLDEAFQTLYSDSLH